MEMALWGGWVNSKGPGLPQAQPFSSLARLPQQVLWGPGHFILCKTGERGPMGPSCFPRALTSWEPSLWCDSAYQRENHELALVQSLLTPSHPANKGQEGRLGLTLRP